MTDTTIDRPEAVPIPSAPGAVRRRSKRLAIGVVIAGLLAGASFLVVRAVEDSPSSPGTTAYSGDWKDTFLGTGEARPAYTGDWKDSLPGTAGAQPTYTGDWKDTVAGATR